MFFLVATLITLLFKTCHSLMVTEKLPEIIFDHMLTYEANIASLHKKASQKLSAFVQVASFLSFVI